jgi:hypothetical protein
MKQGTKRLLSMALALSFIVGSFVVFFELTQPSYKGLEQLIGKRNGEEKFLNEQKPAVQNVKDLIANYTGENAGDLRNALSKILPLGPNMSSALVQIEGLVRLSGLSLQNLTTETTRNNSIPSNKNLVKPVGTIVFRVGFAGSYNQIKDFATHLENNILLLEIRSISVQPGGKSGVDFFTGTAEVVSYYQQI